MVLLFVPATPTIGRPPRTSDRARGPDRSEVEDVFERVTLDGAIRDEEDYCDEVVRVLAV